jgi:hypothetical protein
MIHDSLVSYECTRDLWLRDFLCVFDVPNSSTLGSLPTFSPNFSVIILITPRNVRSQSFGLLLPVAGCGYGAWG